MSYDLYFLRPREAGPLAWAEVAAYFSLRPGYQVDPSGSQAFYENEATGVYFAFDRDDDPHEAEPADGWIGAGIAFNLNYVRPHVFGLEAEPEVAAFVHRFGLAIDDPQRDGMGRGAYSEAGFLQGWNDGNRFGYQVITEHQGGLPEGFGALPAAEIARLWRWNMGVDAFQRAQETDVFVPRIFVASVDGQARTVVVWPDAIPIMLPQVDHLIIGRQELGRRRWGGLRGPAQEFIGVPWAAVEPLLAAVPRAEAPAAGVHWRFGPAEQRGAAAAFVRALPPGGAIPTMVAMDHVLDMELLAEARRA